MILILLTADGSYTSGQKVCTQTLDDFNFADGSTRNCSKIISGAAESGPMRSGSFFLDHQVAPVADTDMDGHGYDMWIFSIDPRHRI